MKAPLMSKVKVTLYFIEWNHYTLSNFEIRHDVIVYLRQVTVKCMCTIWNLGKTCCYQLHVTSHPIWKLDRLYLNFFPRIHKHYMQLTLKEPGPITSFFSNFLRFYNQKKAHVFLITTGEFYSWKMYRLEDMKMWLLTSKCNHN